MQTTDKNRQKSFSEKGATMNKNDPRYIAAENRIMDAVYSLFAGKDIDEIRTQEIIRTAGVHKSTFYSHYKDKYALLDAIESRISEELYPHLESIFINMLGERKDPEKLIESYEDLAAAIIENKALFRIILRGSRGTNITARIASEIENIWEQQKIADPKSLYNNYLINATVYVMIGTIEKWLKRDCIDSREDLVNLINATGIGIQNAYEMM